MVNKKVTNTFIRVVLIVSVIFSIAGCGDKEAQKKEAAPIATYAAVTKKGIPHRVGKEFIGVSDKNIDDLDISFKNSVRNDATGKWRLAMVGNSADFKFYALSYKNKYFKSSDEVHVFINFADKKTIAIKDLGAFLDLSVLEYVKGEEHDAKQLAGGRMYEHYFVYLDNGDIERIK